MATIVRGIVHSACATTKDGPGLMEHEATEACKHLVNKPVYIEHDSQKQVGTVVGAFLDADKNIRVEINITDNQALRATGPFKELALAYQIDQNQEAIRMDSISFVKKSYFPGSVILDD